MSNFAQVTQGLNKPLKIITIEPGLFASSWAKRPPATIALGLRTLSEADVDSAEKQAERRAAEYVAKPDEYLRVYNHELMCCAVARGICDPNNTDKPAPFLEYPEDTVPKALTPAGLRYIFDALEQALVESSPIYGEATDAEVLALADGLRDGALSGLSPALAARARRFLKFILNDLQDVGAG